MALQDRVTIPLAEMKRWLEIAETDTRYDGTITDLVEIAIEQADAFLQNDFETVDENGNVVAEPVPVSVNLAIKKMVASWLSNRTDDQTTFSLGDARVQVGQIPWDSEKLLTPFRKFVGL